LSPVDLGGAPRQFIRKPEQQAGYIPLEMEMGLFASLRPGRHAPWAPRSQQEGSSLGQLLAG
jgi:hypothetical protein